MKCKLVIKALSASVLSLAMAGFSSQAMGASLDVYSVPTGVDASGINVSINVNGGTFSVANNSSIASSITGVYFESGWSNVMQYAGLQNWIGRTAFKGLGVGEAQPADVYAISGWNSGAFGFKLWDDNVVHGVNNGSDPVWGVDGLNLFFNVIGGANLASLLGQDGYRIVFRLQGLEGAASTSQVGYAILGDFVPQNQGQQQDVIIPTHAPTPSAALAGLGLMAMGLMRRRGGLGAA